MQSTEVREHESDVLVSTRCSSTLRFLLIDPYRAEGYKVVLLNSNPVSASLT